MHAARVSELEGSLSLSSGLARLSGGCEAMAPSTSGLLTAVLQPYTRSLHAAVQR